MDWKPIIIDLERHMTQSEIATEAGMSSGSHVNNLKHGRQSSVSYEIGCRLVDMHRRVTRKERRRVRHHASV